MEIYTRQGKVALNEEMQETLKKENLEVVICYLIDTDQIDYISVDSLTGEEYEDMLENNQYCYIDNTMSDEPGKNICCFIDIVDIDIVDIHISRY